MDVFLSLYYFAVLTAMRSCLEAVMDFLLYTSQLYTNIHEYVTTEPTPTQVFNGDAMDSSGQEISALDGQLKADAAANIEWLHDY